MRSAILEKLSVVVHTPMPTPKSCKTFRFENDSLKKTECCLMLPGKTRNSFFVRRCRVEWNENGSFLKNAFLKIPNAFGDSRKLSVVVHTPMPTPKSCKTFRFENDSLKKTECSPMLPGKKLETVLQSSLPSRVERKRPAFEK